MALGSKFSSLHGCRFTPPSVPGGRSREESAIAAVFRVFLIQLCIALSRECPPDQQQNIQAFYPPGSLDVIAAKVASSGALDKIAQEWRMPRELASDLVSGPSRYIPPSLQSSSNTVSNHDTLGHTHFMNSLASPSPSSPRSRASMHWLMKRPDVQVKLSLFDIVLYVDDSGSMAFEERGERIDDLKLYVGASFHFVLLLFAIRAQCPKLHTETRMTPLFLSCTRLLVVSDL